MKRISTLLVPALVATSVYSASVGPVAHAETSDNAAASLVIEHVNVVDVVAGELQKDMTVVIKNNKIQAVGKSGEVTADQHAKKIDATGQYVIPGLWDMHTHIKHEDEYVFSMSLANGVTGLRDMGSYLEDLALWQRDAKEGKLMPHIYSSGMMIEANVSDFAFRFKVDNEQEGRFAVQELKRRGADFVKVYENLTRDEYFGIMDEAHKLGLTVSGHVPMTVSYEEASNAGQRSIEHLYGYFMNTSHNLKSYLEMFGRKRDTNNTFLGAYKNEEAIKDYSAEEAKRLFGVFAKNQTYMVPTLYAHKTLAEVGKYDYSKDAEVKYVSEAILDGWQTAFSPAGYPALDEGKILKAITTFTNENYNVINDMNKAGVPILAGTDIMYPDSPFLYPGISLHDELEELVDAGLTPAEALRTATINPAQFMENEDQFGTVEKGKEADLVLLSANPLEEISNTKKIESVILGGRVLEKSELDNMLKDKEGSEPAPATFVHVRSAEQHGVKVAWDGGKRQISLTKGNEELVLTLDSNIAKLNGNRIALAEKIQLTDGKTMVPDKLINGLFNLYLH